MSDKLDAEIRAMASIARGAFGLTPAGLDDVNLLCGRILEAVASMRTELDQLRSRLASQGAREVDGLRERLAALCHEQWSGWMRHLFSKCAMGEDGACIIPDWAEERWRRQMSTPYADLSPTEQDSDRREADRFLLLLPSDGAEG